MKEIPLTQGKVALVSDEDHEFLSAYKWHLLTSGAGGAYFYAGRPKGVKMHRVVMERTGSTLLNSECRVDHINGDGLDNQRGNSRLATRAQNRTNSNGNKGASSKYKGVCWDKAARKWAAQITVAGRCIKIGRFGDEQDAARAYDKAAREHFGEFARPNFPDE